MSETKTNGFGYLFHSIHNRHGLQAGSCTSARPPFMPYCPRRPVRDDADWKLGKRNVVEKLKRSTEKRVYFIFARRWIYSASPTARAKLGTLALNWFCDGCRGAYCHAPSRGGKRTVDGQLRVTDDLLDLAVGLEVLEGFPGNGAVDLETIDEGGDGDQAVRLNVLVEPVTLVLVENDGVLGLVLDCGGVSFASSLTCVRCAASAVGGCRGCAFVRAVRVRC